MTYTFDWHIFKKAKYQIFKDLSTIVYGLLLLIFCV